MLQQCIVRWRKAQKGAHYALLCMFASAHVCTSLCVHVCLSAFVSAQGTKEQNEPEVAWQHKTLPNVNFEDVGTAGGGERKKRPKWKAGKRMLWLQCITHDFRQSLCQKSLLYDTRYECIYKFMYVCTMCVTLRVDIKQAKAKKAPILHRCLWETRCKKEPVKNIKQWHKRKPCYRLPIRNQHNSEHVTFLHITANSS